MLNASSGGSTYGPTSGLSHVTAESCSAGSMAPSARMIEAASFHGTRTSGAPVCRRHGLLHRRQVGERRRAVLEVDTVAVEGGRGEELGDDRVRQSAPQPEGRKVPKPKVPQMGGVADRLLAQVGQQLPAAHDHLDAAAWRAPGG